MRLIDADKLLSTGFPRYVYKNGIGYYTYENHYRKETIDNAPTVKAIPIEVFYKMIHNALADTKKENWEPEECPYDYFDGNRNAIHCMLDILCGDKDGDHDDFWKEYMDWGERK